jgi:hypothetical protein
MPVSIDSIGQDMSCTAMEGEGAKCHLYLMIVVLKM